jgi:hypothetical protein
LWDGNAGFTPLAATITFWLSANMDFCLVPVAASGEFVAVIRFAVVAKTFPDTRPHGPVFVFPRQTILGV